jgi:hypothetical protein
MYHYVYKVEHIETGEYYIGSRSSKVHPSIDSYLGSMKTWNPDKTKLRKMILSEGFSNREEAIEFESIEIYKNIRNQLNRNYHVPGKSFHTNGFSTVIDNDGNFINVRVDDPRYLSGELKHISSRNLGNQQGNKNSQFGTRWINDGTNSKKIKSDVSIPEGWKLGAIQNKLKGLGWITNGTENARLSKEEIPPDGWKFGKTQRKK